MKKLNIRNYLLMAKVTNQLLYTFGYYCLSLLLKVQLLQKQELLARTIVQSWLIAYSLFFVIFGIVGLLLLNQYANSKVGKAQKALDALSTILDALYLLCEVLVLVELFKKIPFTAISKEQTFSIYEIICMSLFSFMALISTIYIIDSAYRVYKNQQKNHYDKSDCIALAQNILGLVSIMLVIGGYITGNLEDRNIINSTNEIKFIGFIFLVAAALVGSISVILGVYDYYSQPKQIEPATDGATSHIPQIIQINNAPEAIQAKEMVYT